MAKVTDFKFQINGEDFKVNVNCTSSGEFTANIPEVVASALGIDDRFVKKTLEELRTEFFQALKKYKEAETKQELFIWIKYASSGNLNRYSDGSPLFGGYQHKYELQMNSWNYIDAVGLSFKVMIKETVDAVESWYNTRQGKEYLNCNPEQQSNPEKYYKENQKTSLDKHWKAIPYSEPALQTLLSAREGLRKISELLFNFIEQDEKMIEQTLLKQKLLS